MYKPNFTIQWESSGILLAGAQRSLSSCQLKFVRSHSKAPQEYPSLFQGHTASCYHSASAKLVTDLLNQSKDRVNYIVTVDLYLKDIYLLSEKGELEFNLF